MCVCACVWCVIMQVLVSDSVSHQAWEADSAPWWTPQVKHTPAITSPALFDLHVLPVWLSVFVRASVRACIYVHLCVCKYVCVCVCVCVCHTTDHDSVGGPGSLLAAPNMAAHEGTLVPNRSFRRLEEDAYQRSGTGDRGANKGDLWSRCVGCLQPMWPCGGDDEDIPWEGELHARSIGLVSVRAVWQYAPTPPRMHSSLPSCMHGPWYW